MNTSGIFIWLKIVVVVVVIVAVGIVGADCNVASVVVCFCHKRCKAQ